MIGKALKHNNFKSHTESIIKSVKIDTLLKDYFFDDYLVIIKLDVEGNEINN